MKTGISVNARTKLRLLSTKIDVLVDRPRLKSSLEIGLGAQSRRSEPIGVARAACFERLAGVFARRVVSLTKCPVSQS